MLFWRRNRGNPTRRPIEITGKAESYVGALDVGSHMVKVLIGVRREGGVEIKSVGTAESNGIHDGKIRDVESTVRAIELAVKEAGSLLGIKRISDMPPMVLGIGGDSISSLCSFGLSVVGGDRITRDHITISLETANAVPLSEGHTLIHTEPQEFVVDHQRGIQNPLGMVALRLESWVYLITARSSYVKNLITCAHMAGVEVDKIAAIPVALAKAVLVEDEKELGSVVIDIGENFTHIVIYNKGKLERVASLSVGGYNIIKGISQTLRTSLEDARVLKDNYWEMMEGYGIAEDRVEVPLRGDRGTSTFSVSEIEAVLRKEFETIFSKVNSFLVNNRCKDAIDTGAVITGGNAKIEMVAEVARSMLEMDVRVGMPRFQVDSKLVGTIKSPLYATAAGLLCYGSDTCGVTKGEVLKLKGRTGREEELPMGVKVAGFLI